MFILHANLPEYRTITEQNNTFKSKLLLSSTYLSLLSLLKSSSDGWHF